MTWKEFKQAVERDGVSDETEINYVDICSTLRTAMYQFTMLKGAKND